MTKQLDSNTSGYSLDGVEYKEAVDKIKVEYTEKGDDVYFQINIPKGHVKYWRNIDNKPLYRKLMGILDKARMPDDIKVDIASPTDVFNKVTIVCRGLSKRPFSESFTNDVAHLIAKELY